jgi:hypothetical protein
MSINGLRDFMVEAYLLVWRGVSESPIHYNLHAHYFGGLHHCEGVAPLSILKHSLFNQQSCGAQIIDNLVF